MCVIIDLPPNISIPFDKLFNAAANNWHSWGLVVVKDGDLDITQSVPINADVPENKWRSVEVGGCWKEIDEIVKLLDDNIQYQRYLHFRHATKGHVDLDNSHPFIVYKDEKRTVCMMHNGQFNGNLGVHIDNDGLGFHNGQRVSSGCPSDTKEFIDRFIKVPLAEFANGNYNDPVFKEYYLDKLVQDKSGSSTLLFIANDLDPKKYGTWTLFKNEAGEVQWTASNNSYFDRVQRGPLFQQREDDRLDKIRQEAQKTNSEKAKEEPSSVVITPYSTGMFQQSSDLIEGIKLICQLCGGDHFPDRISDLASASVPEFENAVHLLMKEDNAIAIAGFIDYLIRQYVDLEDSFDSLKKELAISRSKHTEATKTVTIAKKELAVLQARMHTNEPRSSVG